MSKISRQFSYSILLIWVSTKDIVYWRQDLIHALHVTDSWI